MKHVFTDISTNNLKKKWARHIADCGETEERSLVDSTFKITWQCLYNFKRMQRRNGKVSMKKTCAFCEAVHSDSHKLGELPHLNIYGNSYPIEPMHLLFFNADHKVDPVQKELETLISVAHTNPDLKILLSNRRGSGASLPDHMHIHAFLRHLPIEDALEDVVFEKGDLRISTLRYPAWTLKVSHIPQKFVAKFTDLMIKKYEVPFNISFISDDIYVIPRKTESPKICEDLVDGVGSLETAGVYTTVSSTALHQINLQTFHRGLADSSFADDAQFQRQFIQYCITSLGGV